jgi:5-hydroxyisourate hydrolase-like protein (transthyretin family)
MITGIEKTVADDRYRFFIVNSNPLEPRTTLGYHIPNAADVIIEIYNTRGQKVLIINRNHVASGRYSLELDMDKMANGLYLVSFSTDNFYRVQKMIVK